MSQTPGDPSAGRGKRGRLPWIVAGSLVLVVAVVVVLVVTLTGGHRDFPSARAAGEAAATAFAANDADEMEAIACESAPGSLEADYDAAIKSPPNGPSRGKASGIRSADVKNMIVQNEDIMVNPEGSAVIRAVYTDDSTRELFAHLVKHDDAWCVRAVGVLKT